MDIKHFHHPRKYLHVPILIPGLSSPLIQFLLTILTLIFFLTFHINIIVLYMLLCVWCLAQNNGFEVYPCGMCISSLFLFYCWVLFHWMDIPLSFYLIHYWWTFDQWQWEPIMNKGATNTCLQIFCRHVFISLGKYLSEKYESCVHGILYTWLYKTWLDAT